MTRQLLDPDYQPPIMWATLDPTNNDEFNINPRYPYSHIKKENQE